MSGGIDIQRRTERPIHLEECHQQTAVLDNTTSKSSAIRDLNLQRTSTLHDDLPNTLNLSAKCGLECDLVVHGDRCRSAIGKADLEHKLGDPGWTVI
jgi:hypothetical protein